MSLRSWPRPPSTTTIRHGRSSDSTGTGKQSAHEPPPCLNTKKCAGEKHYLSDCPHTGKYEAMALLSEYKKKRVADMKEANFKTLGNNGATGDNRDSQAAYLTAENLGVKVRVLADIGSDCSVSCRPDQFSRSSYVDDNRCFIVSSLRPLFYSMSSHRDIYIYEMLRNDYTVRTRCRHRGGMVVPLVCKACRAIR
jgi:hypothetical protein